MACKPVYSKDVTMYWKHLFQSKKVNFIWINSNLKNETILNVRNFIY